jgi:hypothetical protein
MPVPAAPLRAGGPFVVGVGSAELDGGLVVLVLAFREDEDGVGYEGLKCWKSDVEGREDSERRVNAV